MKNTIKLWVSETSQWKEFDLSDNDELIKRNIKIANSAVIGNCPLICCGVIIGEGSVICDGAVIGCNVTIGDGAVIGNGTIIGSCSVICDGAVIGSNVIIGDDAVIGVGARIGSCSVICNGAKIGSDATIGDDARIGEGAVIPNGIKVKTIFIIGSKHPIYWWGENKVNIGCKQKSIEEWETVYERIAAKENYTLDIIDEYKEYLNIIKSQHLKYGFK